MNSPGAFAAFFGFSGRIGDLTSEGNPSAGPNWNHGLTLSVPDRRPASARSQLRRHWPGVIEKRRLNARVKCAASSNPLAKAICAMD